MHLVATIDVIIFLALLAGTHVLSIIVTIAGILVAPIPLVFIFTSVVTTTIM